MIKLNGVIGLFTISVKSIIDIKYAVDFSAANWKMVKEKGKQTNKQRREKRRTKKTHIFNIDDLLIEC